VGVRVQDIRAVLVEARSGNTGFCARTPLSAPASPPGRTSAGKPGRAIFGESMPDLIRAGMRLHGKCDQILQRVLV